MKTAIAFSHIVAFWLFTLTASSQDLYTGVWTEGSDAYYLWSGVEWTNFENKWKELGGKNYRLEDIETYVEGGKRKYSGVWRAGSDGYYLWAGKEWTDFENKWKELSGKNLRLVDIETYMDGSKRKYIGVWRQGSDGHYLWAGQEWASFESKWKELSGKNLRLVDLETYMDGSKRKYTGVWRQGSGGHYLWSGVDWENFTSKWAENGQKNLRLIDLETFESSCQDKCLNTALMPDDPATASRDGYNYGITGSNLHCEAQPGSCPGTISNVVYRWPNVKYGDTYYLRLSSIYDAKDKIFTLPFKDKASDMSKNGWRYSNGGWHHALDYSRKDGKTFQVRAAAPGKAIYFGWDNWSGGTMVVSHDVGNKKDVYRTIYMHLRNGANNDCESAWTKTLPSLDADQKTAYKNYLNATGCPQDKAKRSPAEAQWGTNSQTINMGLINKTVKAGDVLGWAGSTGPGGCGCMSGGTGPNTHLHIFFAHRDPTDNKWYFFDPYGIYGTPDCYPGAVDGAINTACSRYPVSWKGGKPGY